jgi:hypothetical protein
MHIYTKASIAEKWFNIPIPITGIKSTSVVYERAESSEASLAELEPFALFCEEYEKYNTHLEVYPRKSGEVYVCVRSCMSPYFKTALNLCAFIVLTTLLMCMFL